MQITTESWRLYTITLPSGATPLGVIRRDNGERGALVRIERTGQLVQVNAGVIRSLDQRAAHEALRAAG